MSEQANRVKEIRARLANTTEGFWFYDDGDGDSPGVFLNEDCNSICMMGDDGVHMLRETSRADANFIANSKRDITYLLDLLDQLQRETEPVPLTTEQLIKLDIAYFVFEDEDLRHLSGWRVRRYCPQTEGHEFVGKEATYVDSRYYDDGNNGFIAFAREPKGEATT